MTAGLLVDAGENEGRVQGHRAEGADGDPENSPFTPGREDRHAAPPAPHGAPELVDGHRQGSSPANEKRHIIPTSAATREILMGSTGKGEGVYNVVVIGAGTAGLVTAAGTAGLGGRVALIERNRMGGDCLNFGCVPSKALIRSSRVAALMRRADLYALDPVRPLVDYGRVARRVKSLRARNILLATGGRAAVPDVPGLKEAGYETNETIFEREIAPGRLLVLGGGPIGCELAQAMAR